MSDSSSLDSEEQLRSAAAYGAQRPARVLGKTDIAWIFDAPKPPAPPEPDPAEVERQAALIRDAEEREKAAEIAAQQERERQAEIAAQRERERQAEVAAQQERERRADIAADEERSAWAAALAEQAQRREFPNVVVHETTHDPAVEERARAVIREIASARAEEPVEAPDQRNPFLVSMLRSIGFAPPEERSD